MSKKFRVLRIVSTILKIIAWIVLVIGVLGGCGILVIFVMGSGSGPRELSPLVGALGGTLSGIVFIIVSLFYFLIIYAYGELITLLIALEENTRLTAERLQSTTKPST